MSYIFYSIECAKIVIILLIALSFMKIKEEKRFILFPYYCRSCFRFIAILLFFRRVNLIFISN